MTDTQTSFDSAQDSPGIQEAVKATGSLDIVVRDELGNIKEERHIPNLVVTVGKAWIAGRLKDTAGGHTIPTQMSHMAIGSGTANPADADTALGTELGRTALTTSGGTVSSATVTYAATFAAGTGTGAVTEAGIFNASSAGTMICRTKFDVVNKAASDSLSINWSVTIS